MADAGAPPQARGQVPTISDVKSQLSGDNSGPLALVPADKRQEFVQILNRMYGTTFRGPDDPALASFPAIKSSASVSAILAQTQYQDNYQPVGGSTRARLSVDDQIALQNEAKQRLTQQPTSVSQPLSGEVDNATTISPRALPYMGQLTRMAQKYGVPWQVLFGIINHESSWDANAVGDYGNSHGLAQIYAPAHPDISTSEANDPNFAIEWTAQNLAQNYGSLHNWALAALAHNSPGAAQYLAAHQGLAHAPGRNGVDQNYISSVFSPGGKSLTALGLPDTVAGDVGNLDNGGSSAGGAGGLTAPYTVPNTTDLRQQVTDNFRKMFMRDPTRSEVDALSSVVSNVFTSANTMQMAQASNAAPNPYGFDPVASGKAGGHPNPDALLDSNATPGGSIVASAWKYKGVPYQWGGTTAQGLDCSGLVQKAFADVGVDLPRTSQEQAKVGTEVTGLDQAQPGDLLVYSYSGANDHIGIYMGNGQMIVAPKAGEAVQTQSVDMGHLSSIRRVVAGAAAGGMVGLSGQMASTNVSAPSAANGIYGALQSTPEYKQLYGNKPASQTEDQYAQPFLDAGHQSLGADANVDQATRAGLVTGQAATTAGYAAGTTGADQNASFRQLMYKKAALLNTLA